MRKGINGKMSKKEFREITEMLEENYNKQMDTRILELWYQEFKDYPADAYQKMVVEIIRNENFMPTLAKMRKLKKPSWFSVEVKKIVPSEEERNYLEELLREFK